MSWRVTQGNCIAAMRAMPEASVDAIVTDPPYGIGFMGKAWDGAGDGRSWAAMGGPTGRDNTTHSDRGGAMIAGKYDLSLGANQRFQQWCEAWASEALRVLKPGGHLLAFGGTRTYHRLACAIEDAGFEIRDTIAWMYGSGFPKSLDVSKAIDKAAGAEREVVGTKLGQPGYSLAEDAGPGGVAMSGNVDGSLRDAQAECAVTAPATPEAEQWAGWGTALKPAHEPIVVARKPLTGTVAANVLAHGTGALNVDGCRIGTEGGTAGAERGTLSDVSLAGSVDGTLNGKAGETVLGLGRWPANVVLDETAAAMLDAQTGSLQSGSRAEGVRTGLGYHGANGDGGPAIAGDSGGASRFLYVAKASSAERNAGLDGFEEKRGGMRNNVGRPLAGHDFDPVTRNSHPTVKPIALMRWLVRLVTPPGGAVLDPFTGSGTTGVAAVLGGFEFVGIEREAEYVATAEARIAWWARHPDGMTLVKRLEAESKRKAVADSGQASMFDLLDMDDAA